MLNNARRRAKAFGLEFGITVADICIPTHCPILGIPLVTAAGCGIGKNQDNSPSLDRIDNSQGYTKSNVHVISWRANRLKGNATLDELRRLYEYFEGRPVWKRTA